MIRAFCLGLLGFSLSGCAPAKSPTDGGDPERMSDSEYDVARDLWLRQMKPRDALGHAMKAVELNEDNYEASHLVALIYLSLCSTKKDECRLGEAEKYARLAVLAKEDFREAKNTLGVILIHEKRYDSAIGVLKPLSEDILYQTPENAWGNLGWAYLEKGKVDLAIDALRRSIAAQPMFCVGNYRLGVAHGKKHQWSEAFEAYTRAVETEVPQCQGLQDAFLGRGRILLRLDRRADAAQDLTRCKELSSATDAGKECSSILSKLR